MRGGNCTFYWGKLKPPSVAIFLQHEVLPYVYPRTVCVRPAQAALLRRGFTGVFSTQDELQALNSSHHRDSPRRGNSHAKNYRYPLPITNLFLDLTRLLHILTVTYQNNSGNILEKTHLFIKMSTQANSIYFISKNTTTPLFTEKHPELPTNKNNSSKTSDEPGSWLNTESLTWKGNPFWTLYLTMPYLF